MEKEKIPQYSVREMTLDDGEESNELLCRLHIETYTHEAEGITADKIGERFSRQTPEERQRRLEERIASPNNKSWVAVDNDGKIIGIVAPRIEENGTRRIGALYVDSDWQGKGVSRMLMQKAIDWHGPENDIELGVITYNERAKAFYRKWGFEEIPGSETLFDDLMPEIKMIRKGKE